MYNLNYLSSQEAGDIGKRLRDWEANLRAVERYGETWETDADQLHTFVVEALGDEVSTLTLGRHTIISGGEVLEL